MHPKFPVDDCHFFGKNGTILITPDGRSWLWKTAVYVCDGCCKLKHRVTATIAKPNFEIRGVHRCSKKNFDRVLHSFSKEEELVKKKSRRKTVSNAQNPQSSGEIIENPTSRPPKFFVSLLNTFLKKRRSRKVYHLHQMKKKKNSVRKEHSSKSKTLQRRTIKNDLKDSDQNCLQTTTSLQPNLSMLDQMPKKKDLKSTPDKKPNAKASADDSDIEEIPFCPEERAIVDKSVSFVPPTKEELEGVLKRLGIHPQLASNSPLLGLPSLPVNLQTSFKNKNVDGDGNCLYRSVSFLTTGTEEYYWEIREQTYKELSENANLINGIKSEDVKQEYKQKCQDLAKLTKGKVDDSFWGGTTELLGLASMLKLNIVVYNTGKNRQAFFTRCSPDGLRYKQHCPAIFLKVSSKHYQAIVDIVHSEV